MGILLLLSSSPSPAIECHVSQCVNELLEVRSVPGCARAPTSPPCARKIKVGTGSRWERDGLVILAPWKRHHRSGRRLQWRCYVYHAPSERRLNCRRTRMQYALRLRPRDASTLPTPPSGPPSTASVPKLFLAWSSVPDPIRRMLPAIPHSHTGSIGDRSLDGPCRARSRRCPTRNRATHGPAPRLAKGIVRAERP